MNDANNQFENQTLLNKLGEQVEQLQNERDIREKIQLDVVALNVKLELRVAAHERAEKLLSESEQQHRQIFESVTDAMLIFNSDGVIVKVNPAANVTYGYENGEMVGLTGRDIIHPDYYHLFGLFQKELENEGRFRAESLDVRKDGTTIDVDVHGVAITMEGETHLLVVVSDISERKRTETELADHNYQLKERSRQLLESTSDGIYAVDWEGICTLCNPAAVRMLGYDDPAELIGKNAHTLFHHTCPDGSAHLEQECVLLRAYKKDITVDDELFWRADGTSFPVECRASPIYLEQKVVGSVISFTDVSQRRETESQLRRAQKLEAVGQLASGIAHEINTPTQFVNDNTHFLQDAFTDYGRLLTAYDQLIDAAASRTVPDELLTEIKELAEEIEVDYLKEEIPQAIEQSLEGLERIARIVQAMKEFSHPGTEEKTRIDINRTIRTTIDISRNEWKYSAEIETDLDPGLPEVPCQPSDINQVFLDLIVNAAYAIAEVVADSGEKGTISIATRQDGEWVEIRISDNGKGIPEAIQKRIFDPFFTTKEVGKGAGQGLAVVWSVIVDKHGGTIDVESEEDKGTTFIVKLPIAEGTVS